MSEYSELIKRFDKIRDYMRDFYVYGFKYREDFDKKSLRSYDNEKRRIESYLADYMSFSVDENGKHVFIEADCAEISANPLYRAFKAKSFTKNDISLHFLILDILRDDKQFSTTEITDIITQEYLPIFENPQMFDISTVRGKLKEYQKSGLLSSKKEGKRLLYYRSDNIIDIQTLSNALLYFSEVSLLGVVGSFLLDKMAVENEIFSYKHHYIMHTLESEIVYEIVQAMKHHQCIKITNVSAKTGSLSELVGVPLKLLISVQSGRRYVSLYTKKQGAIKNFRLDCIKQIKALSVVDTYLELKKQYEDMLPHTWGSSFGDGHTMEHLKMRLYIAHNEAYIIKRVKREGRHGVITQLDDVTYEYNIDVYDTMEMLPWIRTFIGRIILLDGTNKRVINLFYMDLHKLTAIYGGDENGVF